MFTIQSEFWLGTQVWAWTTNGNPVTKRNANATARIMVVLSLLVVQLFLALSPSDAMRQSDYCYRMAPSISGFGNPFQGRQQDIGLRGAADDAVVDHRARQPKRRVVVGELEVAALARIERRP